MEENFGKNILPLSAVENKYLPGTGPIEVLLFYKKNTSISKLEESLFRAIQYYNLFSSRLIMIGQDKFALQYCRDGVVISVLHPVDMNFDNINIDDIKRMMIHVKTLPGEPLFAVTGIPIKDGVLGAVSCSHAVCDGISLMLFLYVWNCIIEDKSFPFPSTQRLFKGNPVSSDKISKIFTPLLSELSSEIQERVQRGTSIKTYTKTEYFTDEFLNEMKNKAKSENGNYTISNNQIMNAFLIKKYHHNIMPDADKIIIRIPVDLRNINPDIDMFYIGYAVFNSLTEFNKEEIDKMSIPQIAYRLKESINNVRNESFVKEISYLSKYGVEIKADILEKCPPYNVDTDIVSVNLTHLNDIESLFLSPGAGRILYIGVASVKTNFAILKEKNGRMFAQITSRYPLM
ncbi:MAG: hypothetical protein JW976_00295 [Syntrophaceae bacterium]|nr:hypothetical protein [Syntrophaceae bacterium]